jgi:hypothetical protein
MNRSETLWLSASVAAIGAVTIYAHRAWGLKVSLALGAALVLVYIGTHWRFWRLQRRARQKFASIPESQRIELLAALEPSERAELLGALTASDRARMIGLLRGSEIDGTSDS